MLNVQRNGQCNFIPKDIIIQGVKIGLPFPTKNNPLERSPEADIVDINIEEIQQKQKEKYIEKSPLLSAYNEFSKNDVFEYRPDSINVLEEIPVERFKEIEDVCQEIYENTEHWFNEEPNIYVLKNFVDLYYYDKDIYKYCMNSSPIKAIFMNDVLANDCIRNLSLPMAKEIEKGDHNQLINEFVVNSNEFYKTPESVIALNEYLSKNKTAGDITTYRGERHPGMFSELPINSTSLTKKIKFANFVHQFSTKDEKFLGYDREYHNSRKGDGSSLYEYIKEKENLSIADAMLMMKYMNKSAQKEILELIKNAKLEDDGRFKSTTFSEGFAKSWIGSCYNHKRKGQANILSKITLKEGCEGIYVQGKDRGGTNGQFEFIVNNNPKTSTIKNVTYNEETNTFNLEYDLEMD